jgi:hypothetical protein
MSLAGSHRWNITDVNRGSYDHSIVNIHPMSDHPPAMTESIQSWMNLAMYFQNTISVGVLLPREGFSAVFIFQSLFDARLSTPVPPPFCRDCSHPINSWSIARKYFRSSALAEYPHRIQTQNGKDEYGPRAAHPLSTLFTHLRASFTKSIDGMESSLQSFDNPVDWSSQDLAALIRVAWAYPHIVIITMADSLGSGRRSDPTSITSPVRTLLRSFISPFIRVDEHLSEVKVSDKATIDLIILTRPGAHFLLVVLASSLLCYLGSFMNKQMSFKSDDRIIIHQATTSIAVICQVLIQQCNWYLNQLQVFKAQGDCLIAVATILSNYFPKIFIEKLNRLLSDILMK